jgi:hypothetical protein
MHPVIVVLRYIEHVVKKYQVHRRHRVCTVVWEHRRPEQIQVKRSCVLTKKVSTPLYLQNKFTDGVKFIVKIIPSDGVVIGVRMQLLKMLPQTREPDIECRELNVLVLFPSVHCLKRLKVIGDVVITIWIGIQPKEYLHCPAPSSSVIPIIGFPVFFKFVKSD